MTENGMAMSSLKYELGVEHRSWIEQLTGSTINKTTREFAGGSRELWYVDLDPPVAGTDRLSRFPRNLVLRIDSGVGPLSDTRFNLLREASVYRALEKTNVPVPAIFGMTKDNRALLMERISGSSRLATSTTEAIGGLRSLLISLEALHNLDPTSLDLPSFVKFDNMSDCVLEEINYWQTLAQRTTHQADPLVTLAFSWLSTNTPTTTRQPRLVQGDTGPGNFLMANGHVNALVDWELSHFGDPMEDIAWLDQRCTKSPGPFGDTALRDQLYEELSGSPLDLTAIAFYAVFVRLRCVIITDLTISSGGGSLGLNVYYPPHHRFRVELATALCEVMKVEPIWLKGSQVTVQNMDISSETSTESEIIHDLEITTQRHRLRGAEKLKLREEALALEHQQASKLLKVVLRNEDRRDCIKTLGGDFSQEELVELGTPRNPTDHLELIGLLHRMSQRAALLWTFPVSRTFAPIRISLRN